MSDDEFTPTVAQMRDAWVTAQTLRRETIAQHYQGAPVPDYGAEFDRGMAAIPWTGTPNHPSSLRQGVSRAQVLAILDGRDDDDPDLANAEAIDALYALVKGPQS